MYLLEGLKHKRSEIKTSFHVPGHKFGMGLGSDDQMGHALWTLDFTEIPGTDNLHHPETLIKNSQERLATLYGADQSYFLVNGTTGGNLAMIMAAIFPGEKILLGRDCHRSVYNGIILSQSEPVLLEPEMSCDGQVAIEINAETIEKALVAHPDAVAVVLTYPNYYGHCSDIKKIVDIVHKYDRILLVDGAHSAHFVLNDGFPICPVQAGADVVVQSTHKTMLSLTQSSVLHVNGSRVNRERLEYYLSALQTASPSYVLMSSLDQNVDLALRKGRVMGQELLDQCQQFMRRLKAMGLKTYDEHGGIRCTSKDISRINLSPYGLASSGYELDEILRTKFGIQCEFSAENAVVCVSTIGNTHQDFEHLLKALMSLKGFSNFETRTATSICLPIETALSPSQAVNQRRCWCSLEASLGRVSSDFVTPYPPGIPMVIPGMVFNGAVIDAVKAYINSGHEVIGIKTSALGPMVQIIERKSL